MVFGPPDGPRAGCALAMDEAAQATGVETRYIRKALDKPHVRQFLYEQKQVFRASASAQNISRLVELRDTSENAMARLGAIKLLENEPEGEQSRAAARAPGVVIQIVNQGPSEAKPLTTIDVLPNSHSERADPDET